MLNAGDWTPNQPNTILFVLVDASGIEVTGLGSGYTMWISKAGGTFTARAGVKSEIGLGWYKYVSTAGEADTPGPVAIVVTGVGIIQQNLEYVVASRVENTIEFTYTVISDGGGLPIEGVQILIATDSGGSNIIWTGFTDSLGVARDSSGDLPRLQPGNFFFFRYKYLWTFVNPDPEVVS